jgi:nucleotide-binding universal stress UspA family protein
MLTIRHILAPIDFTENSSRALAYAIELAEKFDAKLTILHAYQLPVYGFPDGAYIAPPEMATDIANAAQKALNTAASTYRDRPVTIATLLRQGVPWEEITAAASELGADLIVIGTHGRHGLARALLGSVAENVIRTSPLPVLTLHGRE